MFDDIISKCYIRVQLWLKIYIGYQFCMNMLDLQHFYQTLNCPQMQFLTKNKNVLQEITL
jgi:hypothetical protein